MNKGIKELIVIVVLLAMMIVGVICLFLFAEKNHSTKLENEAKEYEYIVVNGETYLTKELKDIDCDYGYYTNYKFTFKDGTIAVSDSYTLKNEEKEND